MTTADAIVLPVNVLPNRYQIWLQPNLTEFSFAGEETIEVEVLEPTSQIQLNSVEIDIQSATLAQGGNSHPASEISFDKKRETATLSFAESIPAGTAALNLVFSGELNDKLRGFYRSQYAGQDGETRYLAATQFEATDARRAFPCWDEPAHKARFQVTLVVPDHLVALSNTPVAEEKPAGSGLKTVRFAESPIMSTYLLAFIVGDLTRIEQESAKLRAATPIPRQK